MKYDDDWKTLVVSLNNSMSVRKLTMSMVKDVLFNEEARNKEKGTSSYGGMQALEYDGRGRNQGKASGGPNKRRSASRVARLCSITASKKGT